MLSYQCFTATDRQAIIRALEAQCEKIDRLINTVGNNGSDVEFVVTPTEARRLAELVRPYYMLIAHRLENHPDYEPG